MEHPASGIFGAAMTPGTPGISGTLAVPTTPANDALRHMADTPTPAAQPASAVRVPRASAQARKLSQVQALTQTPVHATRPQHFIPYPQTGVETLPSSVVTAFDEYNDQKIKWFATPPVDIVDSTAPVVHSLDYLYEMAQRKQRATVAATVSAAASTTPNAIRSTEETGMDLDKCATNLFTNHKDSDMTDVNSSCHVTEMLHVLTTAWLADVNTLHDY
ncbi:hypothetical protein BASA60_011393 [Batrachochytrium salamandrivorans]|nr:hypothetical protein BASA60_011393 [Batrachochytrium salamandrivorans]KAH9275389.1 hypothetical protein BASA83_002162 [Batrachochytrium salamandrivorans]